MDLFHLSADTLGGSRREAKAVRNRLSTAAETHAPDPRVSEQKRVLSSHTRVNYRNMAYGWPF